MKLPYPLPYSSFTVTTSLPVADVERRLRTDTVAPLAPLERHRCFRDSLLRHVDLREGRPAAWFEGRVEGLRFEVRRLEGSERPSGLSAPGEFTERGGDTDVRVEVPLGPKAGEVREVRRRLELLMSAEWTG